MNPAVEDWVKVTSFFGERQRHRGRLLSDVLLDTFEEHDLASSILLRATAGFGLRHHLRTDQTLTMSEDPSVVAIATDLRSKVEPVVSHLLRLQRRGLLTVERARGLRGVLAGAALPGENDEETRLTVHIGRHERVDGVPAHVAICDLLHRRGVAGASVLVGVDGTNHGTRERAQFWDRNLEVPTMVVAVGDALHLQGLLPELEGLVRRPMLTVERVRVCKRDGELLARPPALPSAPEGPWQKLSVFTSEHHLSHGEPIHRGIVRRLRATRARGVTVLRGIRGFHGDHPPHGDRLFQLGRRVPVVTVVVDTPDGIARSFDVIDELTAEHGLVTAEVVPELHALDAGSRPGR
ncbi:MAG TPA: DUF190 domain-containing protein [Marmoricola sp.]